MTDEEINKKIDLCIGIKWEKLDGSQHPFKWKRNGVTVMPDISPSDYCNDLNAMYEAEKHIMDETSIEYLAFLKGNSCVWHASARLKAEAFLRAWGKWEE